MDKNEALSRFFGYSEFRPGQGELIDSILSKRDTVGIMPTGGGKSICFQIPALLFEGVTIVISPLISLMKDQVSALTENGVRAVYINGSLSEEEIGKICLSILHGEFKIVYVAPERLCSKRFLSVCKMVKVSLVCVDEAHCISQWGQDFRPSYLEIAPFVDSFLETPTVCAFTATATQRVRDDIIKLLCLKEPFVSVLGFDRPNLFFELLKPVNKITALKKYLDLYSGKSGIVYCASRKKVEELFNLLHGDGYSVTKYHAGLYNDTRKRNQELFISGKREIIIATNAFGMGIDKPDVGFVIHYEMPGDLESYYQEAGRAGRDGEKANCILLFSYEDIAIQRYFIENTGETEELSPLEKARLKKLRGEKLDTMIAYCSGRECLRNFMLRYFGENPTEPCENCSACLGETRTVNVTLEAKKLLSCAVRARENENVLCDILLGSENEYINEKGYKSLSTFGIMKSSDRQSIMLLFERLLSLGLLARREDGTLAATGSAKGVLFSHRGVQLLEKKARKAEISVFSGELYLRLKEKRQELAKKSSVPAFTIFTDATLRKMATQMPLSTEELMTVPGISEAKMKKYGAAFINIISKYKIKLTE